MRACYCSNSMSLLQNCYVVLVLLAFCKFSVKCSAQDFKEMVRSTDPLTPEAEQQTFKLPHGFEVQLFASEPEIQKPMNMAFDARGRLWVSGSNDYPYANLEQPGDSIRVLEDTDGDGRADKFTTFVDGITIPMGLYPYQDGVIAFTIPNIVFYRDSDGDGKADQQQILYGPFDYSRDTHGLNNAFRRGLDGWIYACHGFNNRSKVSGADGHEIEMQSGNTYRFRIDGSRIEHYTHGQVNPFGMTFDLIGDLYNSDCHTVPITLLLKDGYYPSFGKPHDGLGFVPAVMTHLHGSTAIAGVTQITGNKFPAEFRNHLLVGNVMTSRVHRDRIEYNGSTVKVVEEPDFLTSSDPWFRPVDIQCGPDQAIYIADFYNRIIGHYEIPLDHPERDRTRGRIWRITYSPDDSKPIQPSVTDLSKLTTAELIAALPHANLPQQYRIVGLLSEGTDGQLLKQLKEALKAPTTEQQRIALLWSLFHHQKLSPPEIKYYYQEGDLVTRRHLLKILAETSSWTSEHVTLIQAGLRDEPLVARAAAMAIVVQPQAALIPSLMERQANIPPADQHLQHALKLALRNCLSLENGFGSLRGINLSQSDRKALSEVCLAISTPQAAEFLLTQLEAAVIVQARQNEVVQHVARHLSASSSVRLIKIVQQHLPNQIDLQLKLLHSIIDGYEQSGRTPDGQLKEWADTVIAAVFDEQEAGLSDWTSMGLKNQKPIDWDIEPRSTADGKQDIPFLSSLPAKESATGTLRSKEFVIPESLSFYLCGHLGFPNQTAIPKNYVSLHLADTGKPVQMALAPRNDTAQKIEWNLREFAGQTGYLQVVDGIDLNAYAWLAIAQIEPPLVRLPQTSPKLLENRLRETVLAINKLNLKKYETNCRELATNIGQPISVRYESLRYLLSLDPNAEGIGLLSLFLEGQLSMDQQRQISEYILEADEEVHKQLLKTMPFNLQSLYARQLARFAEGAEVLHTNISQGLISNQVLQSESVMAFVSELEEGQTKEELLKIAAGLPNTNLQLNSLIKERMKSFELASTEQSLGKKLFEKNCANCHSIGGIGKKIGPQLDGIGNRGLARLTEDILAPNRNVDLAFRTRLYLLEDGKVHSGLFRREEGELTVIATSKGEEVSFRASMIESEKVSPVSIMPENWSDAISAQDFNHLLAYLLSQSLSDQ